MMIVRPASARDVDEMYRLAVTGGKGLTNLPPDRDALARRIDISERTLAGEIADMGEQQVRLVLESEGRLLGLAALWPRVGMARPFYSYRLSEMTCESRSTGQCVTHRLLTLVNALAGTSEVGGLLLDPAARGRGAGKLLARSRYLFIARHRGLFAARVLAELRGYQDEAGNSPFWEGVGRHFFPMEFDEVVRLAGVSDLAFVEELAGRHPLYVETLPPAAQMAISRPHEDGRAAFVMLEEEGFACGDYIDVFDAGPTMLCETGRIRSVANALHVALGDGDGEGERHLIATGERADFRCTRSDARVRDGWAMVANDVRDALGCPVGQDALVLAAA